MGVILTITDYSNNQLSPSAASEHESMEHYLYASL